MSAVTRTDVDVLYPRELFSPSSGAGTLSRLTAALSLSSSQTSSKSTSLFDILASMQEDPALAAGVAQDMQTDVRTAARPLIQTVERAGERIRKHAEEWLVDGSDAEELAKKVEELSWIAVILYGVTGLQPGKQFKADFFT
jgi:hypothetical protein